MILLLLVCSLAQVESRYAVQAYEEVIELAPSALAEPAVSRLDSIQIGKLYAFSLVALGREQEAIVVFRQVLTQEPELVLDPRAVSPKIRGVFGRARHELESGPEPVLVFPSDTVYVRQPVPLSVLVPGLGQLHNRKPVKGYALLAAGLASTVGLVASHVSYDRAHNEYLQATEPQVIGDKYRVSNDWHRARAVFIGTTTIIWAYSLVDALLDL